MTRVGFDGNDRRIDCMDKAGETDLFIDKYKELCGSEHRVPSILYTNTPNSHTVQALLLLKNVNANIYKHDVWLVDLFLYIVMLAKGVSRERIKHVHPDLE